MSGCKVCWFARVFMALYLCLGLMGTQQARAAEDKSGYLYTGTGTPVMTVYHVEGRRSFRVIWTCVELNINCEIAFKPGDMKASVALLRAANPLMPTFPSAEYEGQMLVESGALLELLQRRYGKGKLAPADSSADFPAHLMWMHFAEGTAMYRIYARRYASQVAKIPIEQIPDGYTSDKADQGFAAGPVGIHAVLDFMEDFLSKHPYFGGQEFSTADIMNQFTLVNARLSGFDPVNFKHIMAWNQKIKARPGFKKAMALSVPGGADDDGLPKDSPMPFPEPDPKLPKPMPTVRK